MSLSLKKGQTLSLAKKPDGSLRTKVRIGLGWEVLGTPLDLDATVYLCNSTSGAPICENDANMIFFNQKNGPGDCVVHHGDNRTGAGDGDDEVIDIDFTKVNQMVPSVNEILLFVTIFQSDKEGNPLPEDKMDQHFGLMKDAYLKIYDQDSGTEICNYDLDATYPDKFAVQIGSFKKQGDSSWSFDAVGEGFNKNLMSISNRLRVPSFS